MKYNELLAERIHDAFSKISDVKAQNMFGSLAFMISDKLCVCIRKNGDLMLRCAPEQADELIQQKGARQSDMKGKPMKKGWLLIAPDDTESDEALRYWLDIALDYNEKIRE